MNTGIPVLWNHDPSKPIGTIRQDGDRMFFAFTDEVRIADDSLHQIFGGAGILITDCEMVDGVRIIKAGQILEFSFNAAR